MPTSLVATVLRALGQSPTEMEIHEIIIKVFFTKYLFLLENKTIIYIHLWYFEINMFFTVSGR